MNYAITNDLFVVNADNVVCGGPYKNEESAKRRIRVLKQRDAEAAANTAACDTPSTNFETGAEITEPNTPETVIPTATGALAKLAQTIATTTAPALPDAAKLAASSAYGKSASLAGFVNSATGKVFTHSPYGTMPAGVYPAISKRERRKRWNYA